MLSLSSIIMMMPLIGESLDFRFYFFKQQFKDSLEQFYNYNSRFHYWCWFFFSILTRYLTNLSILLFCFNRRYRRGGGGGGEVMAMTSPNTVAIFRNQIKTVIIDNFLRLTCKITHPYKLLLCIILSTSFTFIVKKVEKTCIFTQTWPDHLLLMTSSRHLVTIVTDHH